MEHYKIYWVPKQLNSAAAWSPLKTWGKTPQFPLFATRYIIVIQHSVGGESNSKRAEQINNLSYPAQMLTVQSEGKTDWKSSEDSLYTLLSTESLCQTTISVIMHLITQTSNTVHLPGSYLCQNLRCE